MMPPNPIVKRGDVILVMFPNSDLISAKLRPALVVQADGLQTGLNQIVVAMISSQMVRAGHLSRVTVLVSLPEGRQSGLLLDSVVLTDNLATVTLSAISRIIGSFSMLQADSALRHTLNL